MNKPRIKPDFDRTLVDEEGPSGICPSLASPTGRLTVNREVDAELLSACSRSGVSMMQVPASEGRPRLASEPGRTMPQPASRKRPPTPPKIEAESLVGRTIRGGYRLDALIATTLTSAVYRATHLELGRPAAVKILIAPPPDSDPLARFRQEAHAAATVNHPAFVQIFDYGVTEEGLSYFTMELLEGETLEARLDRETRIESKVALEIAIQVAQALSALHHTGWVHRDVKPSNIFLLGGSGPQKIKLLDLGAIRSQSETRDLHITTGGRESGSISRIIVGTPRYMSPEQVLGEKLDGRSDLYALGAVVYECLVGSPPFVAKKTLDVLAAHVNETPVPFARRAPEVDVPRPIQRVVLRALEKEPGRRPATAEAMALELERALSGDDPEASSRTSVGVQLQSRRRRIRSATIAGLAAVVLVAAAAALLGFGHARSPESDSATESAPPHGLTAPSPNNAAPGQEPNAAPPSAASLAAGNVSE